MKRVAILASLMLLIFLGGCWPFTPLTGPVTLTLVASPNTGYPPRVVTLTAVLQGATGGNYRFTVEGATYDQPESKLVVEIEELDCEVAVTWTGTGGPLTATTTIGLRNSGPVIMRPVFNGKEDIWLLLPWQRYIVTFPGTYDPQGGPVELVFASVFNGGQAAFSAVFAPPYLGLNPPDPDVYRVKTPTGEIPNAFVFHSHWPIILESDVQSGSFVSDLPYSPPGYHEAGYPADLLGCVPEVAWPTENIPSGDTIITARFRDEQGAETTDSWAVPTGFYVGCGAVQTGSVTP